MESPVVWPLKVKLPSPFKGPYTYCTGRMKFTAKPDLVLAFHLADVVGKLVCGGGVERRIRENTGTVDGAAGRRHDVAGNQACMAIPRLLASKVGV